MTVFCGIDPGITGGVAFLSPEGVFTVDLPTKDNELHPGNLARLIENSAPDIAVLEEAQSFRGQGIASTFRYGQAFGTIIGVLGALSIPIHRIRPANWKKDLGLQAPPKELTTSQKTTWRKKQSLALATELHPAFADQWARAKDNHRAEALLIADWGRRTHVHL